MCGAIYQALDENSKKKLCDDLKLLRVSMESIKDGSGRITLEPGQAATTPAYNLTEKNNIQHIIHAFSPDQRKSSDQESDPEMLGATYYAVFKHADYTDSKSIVLPALGIGVYGWSSTESIPQAISAMKKFLQYKPNTLLTDIYLIDRSIPQKTLDAGVRPKPCIIIDGIIS